MQEGISIPPEKLTGQGIAFPRGPVLSGGGHVRLALGVAETHHGRALPFPFSCRPLPLKLMAKATNRS